MKSLSRYLLVMIALLVSGWVQPVIAEDGWEFEITPHYWYSDVEFDVESDSLDISADADFDEVFNIMEYAVFVYGEARKDRWGFWGSLDLLSLNEDKIVQTFKADVEMDQTLFQIGAAYRIYDEGLKVDLLGGLRYTEIDVDVSAKNPVGRAIDDSEDEDWIEPLVGARLINDWTDWWYSSLSFDVGGAGIGSDFTWQVFLSQGFRLSRNIDLRVGYRYLDIDYDHNGVSVETTTSGPLAGLAFRF